MAITQWTSIVNGQDGDAVSAKFDKVFKNIDDWQEVSQPNITYVDTLKNQRTVVAKSGTHVDTIIQEGIFSVDTGLPNSETSGKLYVRTYNASQLEQELISYNSNAVYRRYYTVATTTFGAWSQVGTLAGGSLQLTPVDDDVYVEGKIKYSSVTKTFDFMGPYGGTILRAGHENHMHVVNNTGVDIPKGKPVRHDGVSGGTVQVALAQADTFDNARILGMTTEAIANGANGAITTFGEIHDMDTNGLTPGVPMYLSDSVAGGLTETPPDIVTQLGGVITADATAGRFFVYHITNQNLPTIYGGMQGLATPTISVTTTAQDITGYSTEDNLVIGTNTTTGEITLPNIGKYRMYFTGSISFTSTTTTRSITVELYDVTGAAVVYSYDKNIPRDATSDGFSFSFPLAISASNVYKIRIKSNVVIDVTFDTISADFQSISVR